MSHPCQGLKPKMKERENKAWEGLKYPTLKPITGNLPKLVICK